MTMENKSGEMSVLVVAAEMGSFSSAGRKVGLTPSAVSKLISRIEERLGTPLFTRSTRALQLTPEGALYVERARRILADIDEVERMVTTGAKVIPRGPLRVSASVAFGERCLLPLVPKFLARYPQIKLEISLTDAVIDLVHERTDIAIRSGALRDSALKARKLIESRRLVIASPAYIKKHGAPNTPQDLTNHNCLRFNFGRDLNIWPFRHPRTKESFEVPVSGNAQGNSGVVLRQLVLGGLGLARLGEFHVESDIESGKLVPVLESYNAEDIEPIHAVYVGHEHLATRVRAFVDFFAEALN